MNIIQRQRLDKDFFYKYLSWEQTSIAKSRQTMQKVDSGKGIWNKKTLVSFLIKYLPILNEWRNEAIISILAD